MNFSTNHHNKDNNAYGNKRKDHKDHKIDCNEVHCDDNGDV